VVDDFSAHPSEDDGSDSDLAAALDFSPTRDPGEQSALDALDEFVPVEKQDVDDSQGPLFTATNPPGTVVVTAYLNGRVQRVDLSPNVTKMTEAQLADEILVVAGVAAIKARAALHTFVAGLLRVRGMDSDSARDFVERRLSLPTPEQASAVEAEFAARYARDVD
jgi:ESX secretion-associated protein EspD/H